MTDGAPTAGASGQELFVRQTHVFETWTESDCWSNCETRTNTLHRATELWRRDHGVERFEADLGGLDIPLEIAEWHHELGYVVFAQSWSSDFRFVVMEDADGHRLVDLRVAPETLCTRPRLVAQPGTRIMAAVFSCWDGVDVHIIDRGNMKAIGSMFHPAAHPTWTNARWEGNLLVIPTSTGETFEVELGPAR
ncbi:MAG: hypothetical protein IT370_37530 [Deltaproteobacteria bacterium]|nr:hypothetical protein [Deltaproteobacteria bacterium]